MDEPTCEPAVVPERPLVLVTVGTDHHPFERLVRWMDAWVSGPAAQGVRCFIQAGTASPPRNAGWASWMPHDRLTEQLDQAMVVVCHGGPGTIAEARRRGIVPIVVPRRDDLGEHVDDHQVRFARRMAAQGLVVVAETEDDLHAALDRALAAGRREGQAIGEPEEPPGVVGFARAVDPLVNPPVSRVRVLYIGGWGRSGSTLLARLLNEVPGYVAVGEMREGWLRGCLEDRLCGCGEPFSACPFWRAVGAAAFGGWDRSPVRDLLAALRRYDRPWAVPALLAASRLPRPVDLDRLLEALSDIYEAIRTVSSAEVIVDSSKLPSYAFLLRGVAGIDLRVLHLTRDPRGVAFSWQKRVRRSDAPGRVDHMLRFGPVPAAVRYAVYNAEMHLARSVGLPYTRLRYEDLVRDPARWLRFVIAFAGGKQAPSDLTFLTADGADLQVAHTVDGNPMRMLQGHIPIRPDETWRQHLPAAHRWVVTALTLPLLKRYGYPVGSR